MCWGHHQLSQGQLHSLTLDGWGQVWNAVDTHKRKSFTSLIHGKYAHEETVATASFAKVYIVVKNLEELAVVEEYIMNGGDKAAFMEQFANATSDGFDPDVDLVSTGGRTQGV